MISEPRRRGEVVCDLPSAVPAVAGDARPARAGWVRWVVLLAVAGAVAAWLLLAGDEVGGGGETRGRGGPEPAPVTLAAAETGLF